MIKGVVLRFEQDRARLGGSAPETESAAGAAAPVLAGGFKGNSVD